MTESKLGAVIRQIDTFPSLPATVTNVMTVTADPESSAHDLMHAIMPDQAMCTTILKIANSSFFGMPGKVATIDRAVMVLGFEEIRNIVLGKAVFTSMGKINSQDKKNVELFWEHSFTCGLAAKILAEHLGHSPSELFIAGLIHDIGKLAMVMTFPEDYPLLFELTEPHQFRNMHYEQLEYSSSHDEIGMQILTRWLFPQQLLMATGYHHKPEQAPEYRTYPILVQMADMLSLMYCCPDAFDGSDAATIISDFLPECEELWLANNLPWVSENLTIWFEKLAQYRKRDQAVLDTILA